MTYTADDLQTLARTLWGEARGESFDGKTAVAWVIRNRAEDGGWFGTTVRDVCRKPKQFSCWNDDDPNAAKLRVVNITDFAFRECLSASAAVLSNLVPDPTFGATHYHTLQSNPTWDDAMKATVTIGNHIFYRS